MWTKDPKRYNEIKTIQNKSNYQKKKRRKEKLNKKTMTLKEIYIKLIDDNLKRLTQEQMKEVYKLIVELAKDNV